MHLVVFRPSGPRLLPSRWPSPGGYAQLNIIDTPGLTASIGGDDVLFRRFVGLLWAASRSPSSIWRTWRPSGTRITNNMPWPTVSSEDIYLRLDETVIPPRSVPIFGAILLDSHQGPMSLPSADSVSRRAVVVALTTLAALTAAAGLYCARLNRAHAPAAMKQKPSSKGRKRERVMPFLFDGV
ncbi:hypothetical protein FOZ60_010125 [Perkinsus olseni]|uniref:Uncharacterized protein n=1 Tax=Perkinsus olseni TaxID=32597 RepID=A0A7J6PCQ5_PEROL|nr:hypothetical protein FOZ60_010125 [Perkinsus olseni]